MIKDVIMALEEERQLHINQVRINLEFLEILLVNIDPSCPHIDKHIVKKREIELPLLCIENKKRSRTFSFPT